MKDTDKLNIVHFGGESKEVIEAEDRWHDEQMTNTEKILRDEWSKEVDEGMPMEFIVDGEKEIADWWINKITQALAEERARVLLLIEKNYTDEIEELRLSNNGLKSKEKFEKVIGIYKNSLLSSLKENDM